MIIKVKFKSRKSIKHEFVSSRRKSNSLTRISAISKRDSGAREERRNEEKGEKEREKERNKKGTMNKKGRESAI